MRARFPAGERGEGVARPFGGSSLAWGREETSRGSEGGADSTKAPPYSFVTGVPRVLSLQRLSGSP